VATERVERRLTAILAADVAGYSRLTGIDEEGTHVQLKDCLRAVFHPSIAEHRGRVVKTTGDGMLAEFGSVVDAVRCAVDVQGGMAERNADVPQGKRIEFRIGINFGDIIIDHGDIFGDGVNVAARLEGIAEPNGICISGAAYEQVRDKVPFSFTDRGEQTVKNIAHPVHVYALGVNDEAVLGQVPAALRRSPFTVRDRVCGGRPRSAHCCGRPLVRHRPIHRSPGFEHSAAVLHGRAAVRQFER
jgi:adenylate cyclase